MTTTAPALCSFPGCNNQDKRFYGRCERHRLEAFLCTEPQCDRIRVHGGPRCTEHRIQNACAICGSEDIVRYGRCTDHRDVPDWCARCGLQRQNQEGLCSRCADTSALIGRVRQKARPREDTPSSAGTIDLFFGAGPIAAQKRKAPPCRTDGCTKKANYRGLCRQHGPPCVEEGCLSPVDTGGFCYKHRRTKRTCRAPGCLRRPKGKGNVCIRHGAVRAACSVRGCANKASYRGLRCRKHSFTTGRCERCHLRQYDRRGLCNRCLVEAAPFGHISGGPAAPGAGTGASADAGATAPAAFPPRPASPSFH